MVTKESLLRPGESMEKMDTAGWVVPRNLLPLGADVIVDWPPCWPVYGSDPCGGKPFRATVDGHYFNGVIVVTWPETWPFQPGRATLNLGDDAWDHIYLVNR